MVFVVPISLDKAESANFLIKGFRIEEVRGDSSIKNKVVEKLDRLRDIQ